jgi:hypothetical protein
VFLEQPALTLLPTRPHDQLTFAVGAVLRHLTGTGWAECALKSTYVCGIGRIQTCVALFTHVLHFKCHGLVLLSMAFGLTIDPGGGRRPGIAIVSGDLNLNYD